MMRRRSSVRRGAVAAQVVICLTAALFVVAVAVDGGLFLTERRHAQATADAAALAGAIDLYKNYKTYAGVDTPGTANSGASAIATANYPGAGASLTVTIRLYPANYLGGPNAGTQVPKGYIEATVTYAQPRFFSSILGSGTVPISARAVARGKWVRPEFGILVLDPTATRALNDTGNGTLNVVGGSIIVNSSDSQALYNGNNGTITATAININGSYTSNGTITTSPVANNINTGVPPTPDPLAYLPEPAPPTTAPKVKDQEIAKDDAVVQQLLSSGQITQTYLDTINKVYLLQPGRYDTSNRLNFQNSDLVIFKQASAGNDGIYYLDGGISSTGAGLLMDPRTSGGMMFFNAGTGNTDNISLSGNAGGVVNLSGLNSGTYQGMLIFQTRAGSQTVSITGNGSFNMDGSFYAAAAELKITGNGESQNVSSQLIGRTISLAGNGTINVNYASGLVAPARQLQLVE